MDGRFSSRWLAAATLVFSLLAPRRARADVDGESKMWIGGAMFASGYALGALPALSGHYPETLVPFVGPPTFWLRMERGVSPGGATSLGPAVLLLPVAGVTAMQIAGAVLFVGGATSKRRTRDQRIAVVPSGRGVAVVGRF